MKTSKFGVLTLILGLTFAITSSAFKPANMDTIYWFESNDSGSMVGSYLSGGPSCQDESGPLCALGFTEDDIVDPEASTPVLKSEVQSAPLSNSDDQSRRIE